MLKCPFCGYANEEGSLFCEQCKSDLSTVTPTAPAAAPATPAVPPAIPVAEPEVPVAQIIDDPAMDLQVAEVIGFAQPADVVPADIIPVAAMDVGPAAGEPIPEATLAPVADEAVTANIPPEEVAPMPLPGMTPPLEIKSPGEPLTQAEAAQAVAEGAHVHPPEQSAAPAAAPATPVAAPVAAPAAPAAPPATVPAGAQPVLKVIRGQRVGVEFPIYPGENYIGRADDKPVDVDLEDQEPPDRVWCSRQHAVILFDDNAGTLTLEDLNSSNGTYVNRQRVYPGQPRQLVPNDTVQIGTVHLKLSM